MKCRIDPIPKITDPIKPVKTVLHITNDSGAPMTFWQSVSVRIKLGDTLISTEAVHTRIEGAQSSWVTLNPGETWSSSLPVTLDLQYFHGCRGLITEIAQCSIILRAPGDHLPKDATEDELASLFTYLSLETQITLEFDDIDWLMRHNGGRSNLFRSNGNIYSYCSNKAALLVDVVNPSKAYALTNHLIDDSKNLYFSNFSVRRRPKATLTPINAVFYRAGDTIMTEYGNAKIDDPDTFEAVDDGLPSLYSTDAYGYLCSYARDGQNAYFFCGSTSTTKAIKVRACKTPETLVSLGHSFARDDRNVYLEATTIKGADPRTFELINSSYWRDAKGIGHMERRMPNADPQTFQPIDHYRKGRLQKKAAYSVMARDKNYFFYYDGIKNEDDD